MTDNNDQSLDEATAAVRPRRGRRLTWIAVTAGLAVVLAAIPLANSLINPPVKPKTWASLSEVDWTNTTIDLPKNPDMGCPDGLQQVSPSDEGNPSNIGKVESSDPSRQRNLYVFAQEPVIADLLGDSKPEAVIRIQCARTLEPLGHNGTQLLAIKLADDRTLAGLAYVGPAGAQYKRFSVASQTLTAQVQYWETPNAGIGWSVYAPAHSRTYKWQDSGFVQTGGRTKPLSLDNDKYGPGAITQLASIMDDDGTVTCPAAQVRFNGAEAASAEDYRLGSDPVNADLNNDGNDEIVVSVQCSRAGLQHASLYVFGQREQNFATLDVPLANSGFFELQGWKLQGKTLTMTLKDTRSGTTSTHSAVWTGTRFEPPFGRYSN